MYTAFFGLREKPFALSPDPRFLFLSSAHREALAHLLYGIEQGEGFIAVTGEVGTGKTTLCRTLLRRLGPEVDVAFLFNPKLSARELLEAILVELGVEARGTSTRELVDALNHFLLERRHEGRRVLLIIDEAQGLAPDTLEQIRLLSNLETETDKLIQILLLGQPELDGMLESDELRQLRQRIGVRWRLGPLSREEVGEYVHHRLRVSAGADRHHLFPEATLREVFRRSRGVPRIVNVLCDRALLAAYGDGAPVVAAAHVARAAEETGVTRVAAPRTGLAGRRLAVATAAAALLGIGAAAGIAWWQGWVRPVLGLAEAEAAAAPAGAAPMPATPVSAAPAAPAPTASAGEGAPLRPEDEAPPLWEEELQSLVEDVSRERASASLAPPAAVPTAYEVPPATAVAAAAPPATREPAPAGNRIDDLATALALRPPGVTARDALAAMLEAWQVEAHDDLPPVLSFGELLDALASHGLLVAPIPDADVARLEAIGHPALLVIDARDGIPRVVALRRLAGERAELVGALASGPAQVDAAELERAWDGESYVVWREFEPLPEYLRVGDAGEGVTWLQRALAELGHSPGPPSGIFDGATEDAVRAFQSEWQLRPDGTVGPLTKMSLYRALGRYDAPLVVGGGAG